MYYVFFAKARLSKVRALTKSQFYEIILTYMGEFPQQKSNATENLHGFLLLLFRPTFELWFKILVQAACMRHLWWRTEAKLAIVFTYFFPSFSFYAFCFSPTSGNLPCVI